MTKDNNSWLSNMFHKKDQHAQDDSSAKDTASPAELSENNTVSEWLDHPVGGKLFRDMLAEAGQNESVLRPVRRLSLKRLVAMSHGRFTEAMLADMIQKVKDGSASTTPTSSSTPVTSNTKEVESPLPVWEEKIIPGRFENKTIIVTGAGSGIGRATASRIAREGGRVVAVDISSERLDEFTTSLPDSDIIVVPGDITNDSDIASIVRAAGEHVDGLANVAGIMDNMTPLHEVSDEIWNRVFAVNVTGMMKLSRAVIPTMLKQKSGSIVNVASEASLRGSAAGAAYTASKHAVVGLTKSAAFMYAGTGIRVNAVAPGPVLTNIEAKFDSELGSERVNAMLANMPDAVEADALAASITFMLSDDSVNLNGAILPSDGGWSAQ